MTRIISIEIQTHAGSHWTVATPFYIDGESDQFAAHRTKEPYGSNDIWTATHVETGFAVCFGPTMRQAISTAKVIWASIPKERRDKGIAHALKIKAERKASFESEL